ncbi:uncharacterized protein NDAI_0B04430 [Naumovozyma dairenensis CBS 421]|uniref:RRM domain-containing protein n=1 Tax=Naumovozyma dairenensis (strain ATCC 10597 / BCRC 20456 / CBS 421 / NBRC 0211 / NRRL Y-12639) TaxID=1071378 RepID=G0W6R6_NAUDC|nr:hypothetical protein NDAI_0B04430 [Naumovozyma dairenensis CBS 421]CCD23477.1 hypothetical protein NDAI_0B04430 [Naumovozyma dairenensis CBS 421]
MNQTKENNHLEIRVRNDNRNKSNNSNSYRDSNDSDDDLRVLSTNVIQKRQPRRIITRKSAFSNNNDGAKQGTAMVDLTTDIEHGYDSNNNLVISTNTNAADRVLVLYNLTLGVNAGNLKAVLQRLSNVKIAHVRVKDLPSGSATANVWLLHPTMEELERVRKIFHGALVDGRTIQVLIASSSAKSFSY